MEWKYPLILDGATGTQLQKRGYTGAECAEKWVLEHPEAILDIQRRYVAAGSQVIYAPTFGANEIKLAEHGLGDKVEEYVSALVALSRKAAEDKALVAGDMSPVGKFLSPMGDMTFEQLVAVYTRQASALEKAGVDIFAIETVMTMAEARAAVLAVKSVSRKPVFVTFTCDGNGRTLMGTDVTAALAVMQGMGVDAFGLNCSAGPREMLVQLRRLRPLAEVPLIAKPNAGMPRMENGQTVYQCPPEEFVAFVRDMAAAGVCIFGGCCGTEESHVAALAETLKTVESVPPRAESAAGRLCATERDVFHVNMAEDFLDTIPCDEDLGDSIEEAQENEEGVLVIRVDDEDGLEYFAECQWQIRLPLCVQCEDAALLEKVLRLYQGRAIYRGPLAEEALAPLATRYGLVY